MPITPEVNISETPNELQNNSFHHEISHGSESSGNNELEVTQETIQVDVHATNDGNEQLKTTLNGVVKDENKEKQNTEENTSITNDKSSSDLDSIKTVDDSSVEIIEIEPKIQ